MNLYKGIGAIAGEVDALNAQRIGDRSPNWVNPNLKQQPYSTALDAESNSELTQLQNGTYGMVSPQPLGLTINQPTYGELASKQMEGYTPNPNPTIPIPTSDIINSSQPYESTPINLNESKELENQSEINETNVLEQIASKAPTYADTIEILLEKLRELSLIQIMSSQRANFQIGRRREGELNRELNFYNPPKAQKLGV